MLFFLLFFFSILLHSGQGMWNVFTVNLLFNRISKNCIKVYILFIIGPFVSSMKFENVEMYSSNRQAVAPTIALKNAPKKRPKNQPVIFCFNF